MNIITTYLLQYLAACWAMLMAMAPYISLGFLMAGVLHIFVKTETVVHYLGRGRVASVIYAALLGVPLPLCSCAVLPTTTGLKKQGANNGAAISFLISTPETGVDSIAVTYALLDPVMTIFRPLAAFLTAITAGLLENFIGNSYTDHVKAEVTPDRSCKIDHCCDGVDCPADTHRRHHTLLEKAAAAVKYGFGEILGELSGWLLLGLAIAGVIHVLVPEHLLQTYLSGGMGSMLIMLVVGIPFYICATGSTPIAAALILKGVSPGAALVFLLAGPATNAATISVVYGLFKQRATAIYLGSIAVCAVLMGLLLDFIYARFNLSATVVAGQAGELLPEWFSALTAVALLALMLTSLIAAWRRRLRGQGDACSLEDGCGCSHSHSHS